MELKVINNFSYPKWALEAFVVANAERILYQLMLLGELVTITRSVLQILRYQVTDLRFTSGTPEYG